LFFVPVDGILPFTQRQHTENKCVSILLLVETNQKPFKIKKKIIDTIFVLFW